MRSMPTLHPAHRRLLRRQRRRPNRPPRRPLPTRPGHRQTARRQRPQHTRPQNTTATGAATATSVSGQTYKKDDLIGAAEGVFGKGAEGLASMIEKILKDQ